MGMRKAFGTTAGFSSFQNSRGLFPSVSSVVSGP